MNFDWKRWLQITSNIAILIGVFLVVWELRQNQALSRAQLASDGLIAQVELSHKLMGENPGLVLSKACIEPDNLTPEEKTILAAIFRSRVMLGARNRTLEQIGNFGIDYESSVRTAFVAVFNYPYFRDEYLVQRESMPEAYTFIADEVLETSESFGCAEGVMNANWF